LVKEKREERRGEERRGEERGEYSELRGMRLFGIEGEREEGRL
jgi:hypothetical protein